MAYALLLRKQAEKTFEKIAKKDPPQEKALKNKLKQIVEDPYRFKPLRAPLQNLRRVHVFGSFVLIYSIQEHEQTVTVEDYDHHDAIYR